MVLENYESILKIIQTIDPDYIQPKLTTVKGKRRIAISIMNKAIMVRFFFVKPLIQ